ncbi:hypothetical protein ACFYVR_24850 [Rhodococcus sp. NPDC003318]|uniref:hypothetical protein n=1 Tax=Rhodococcus sp. NPDC003318 TaxID=3364503 RepID=UPI00368324FB
MEARLADDARRSGPRGAGDCLGLLAVNGYELTDVEKVIAGHASSESVPLD